jgi:L-asparaginase
MKRLLILTCGGTVLMSRNERGYLKPQNNKTDLLKVIPELATLAHVDIIKVVNIDSSNMSIDVWNKLSRMIRKYYFSYDGFIIIHGTDTMVYTASALSFAIQNLDKPIVLTGSQKPLSDIPTDARNNILNAVAVAGLNIPEVLIVFGSKILRGNRSTKISESAFEAFESPMFSPIGEIQLKPEIRFKYGKQNKKKKVIFSHNFNKNVFVLKIHPGINPILIRGMFKEKWEGIVIEAFGAGNVPEILMPVFSDAKKKKVPVIVTNQCHKGITKVQLYYSGYRTIKYGAIPAGDMTPEAAVIKLMWVLSQTKSPDKIKKLFQTNIAGEITINNN